MKWCGRTRSQRSAGVASELLPYPSAHRNSMWTALDLFFRQQYRLGSKTPLISSSLSPKRDCGLDNPTAVKGDMLVLRRSCSPWVVYWRARSVYAQYW